jgi:hypothetical protein
MNGVPVGWLLVALIAWYLVYDAVVLLAVRGHRRAQRRAAGLDRGSREGGEHEGRNFLFEVIGELVADFLSQ